MEALRDKNVAWYDAHPSEDRISPAARQLLESYAGVAPDKVVDHVLKVREEAWEIFPYPCIGQFRFLDLSLNQTVAYPKVLQRLKDGQKLLDMACCFGQEIRQLVADGAPSENLYGCDLRQEYIDLGYKLFSDRESLKTKFLTADIFHPNSALLELQGQLNMIYTGSFFHLWGYDDQVKASKTVASLLRPEPGSVIFGRQVGSIRPGVKDHATNPNRIMYRHDVETFKKLWSDIGKEIGVSFAVEAQLEELGEGHQKFHDNETKRLRFAIKRE